MPPQPKPYVNYPAISTPIDAPMLLGLEYRTSNYVGSSEIGLGVGGYDDFRVTQQGGGSLTVNIGPSTGALQRGFLPGDSNGGTERWDFAGAQLSATAAAADPTNPRIDLVTLAPNPNPDLATPLVLIVKGTATAGTTLVSRAGAPALPVGRILLADILIAAGGTTILTAAIQDRRGFPFAGVTPGPYSATASDMVIPESIGGVPQVVTGLTAGSNDNRAAAMLVWIPRRILANRIRWKYRQGATSAATNYQWILYDASGRIIAATALTAFTGVPASGAIPNNPFVGGPFQLEAGAYYLGFQLPAMTASSTVTYLGYAGVQTASNPGVVGPNLFATGSPGTILGGANTRLQDALSDAYVGGDSVSTPIPACTIGV